MPGKRCKIGQGRRSRKAIGLRRKHAFKQPAVVSVPISCGLEESVPEEVNTSVVVEVNFLLPVIAYQYTICRNHWKV